MKNKLIIYILILITLSAMVFGVNEITQDADKLNYWTSENHVITVTNTGTEPSNATISSSWTVSATDGVYCTNTGNDVECILDAGEIGTYTVTSDDTVNEYSTQEFSMTVNGTYTSEVVTFVKIQDSEIFRTLVEYGRGRGNYFYDSGSDNVKKGIQCTDLPANTSLELNYLHKIYPIINNYLNVPSAQGTNLNLSCQYPNSTMTKQHLATSVIDSGITLDVNYSSDWIKNSWEKVLFLVQDIDEGERLVGENISISCTGMQYYLADANGWVKVSSDNFTLDFQNATPITVTATSNPTTIGTGQTEVEITYTIINNEDITLSSSTEPVTIDIEAPQEAKFIGVKGQLWGTSLSKYRYEVNSIDALANETITLVARFDTSGATPLLLSNGVSVSFIPCWQVNAYNPLSTEQIVTVTDTITVDGSSAVITDVIQSIEDVNNTVTVINDTTNTIQTYVEDINTTVTTIQTYVDDINTTVTTIQIYVEDINATVTAIESAISDNLVYLQEINTTTHNNYDFLTTEIVDNLNELNVTTQDTNVIVRDINTTANMIEVYVTDINGTVDTINSTLNTVSGDVTTIITNVGEINTTTQTSLNIVQYINETRWGNITAQMLYDQLGLLDTDSISTQLTQLSTDLRQLEEFEEESIYLITDSITEGQNAYKEALTAIDNGDAEEAILKLQDSIDKLSLAEKQIIEVKSKEEGINISEAIEEKDISIMNKIIGWIKNIFNK